MNYDLAKKLKDAGFPQPIFRPGAVFITPYGHPFEVGRMEIGKDDCFNVNLAELIEACGRPFMLNIYEDGSCQAFHDTHTITTAPDGEGATAEEAVANLWIALKQ